MLKQTDFVSQVISSGESKVNKERRNLPGLKKCAILLSSSRPSQLTELSRIMSEILFLLNSMILLTFQINISRSCNSSLLRMLLIFVFQTVICFCISQWMKHELSILKIARINQKPLHLYE